jgi:hypothetical protein
VLRRTVGGLPKGRQILCRLTLTRAADVFAKSAFHDGFPLYLELADGGMIVALLDTTWDRSMMRRTP